MTQLPDHTLSRTLRDDLGPVTLHAATLADLLTLQRYYGALGARPDLIPGGYRFPYAQHDTFDFALLGGRAWVSPEGEKVIIAGGEAYRQRVMEAVDIPKKKLKLPPLIKYSRGAKTSDPEHLVEEGEGEFKYVTLVSFKGGGRARAEYSLPGGRKHTLALQAAVLEAAD